MLKKVGYQQTQHDKFGNVILVTGDLHIGKTTLISDFLETPLAAAVNISGIIANGLWKNNLRDGFDLLDLSTRQLTALARRRENQDPVDKVMFDFFDTGMQAGATALSPEVCKGSDLVIVDEVGKLEARGKGWAEHLEILLKEDIPLFIWVARRESLDHIIKRFRLDSPAIIDVQKANPLQCLIEQVKGRLVESAHCRWPRAKEGSL